MKTIVIYGRRNTCLIAIPFVVSKGFIVKVIPEDENAKWMAESLGCEVVTLDTMGEFDLFLCVHGSKIIPKEYLHKGKWVNIHPCIKYKGHDPVSRYLSSIDNLASVDSLYMIEAVDEGEVICSEYFETGTARNYAEFYNIALQYYFKVIDKTLEILNKC